MIGKLLCRLFECKFTRVIGSSEMALIGNEWEFSCCTRCRKKNPKWSDSPSMRVAPSGDFKAKLVGRA